MIKNYKAIVGIIITLAGLYYSFQEIELQRLMELMNQISVTWYFLSISFAISAVWIRAIRWKFLLKNGNEVRLQSLFNATMIGYFGNGILPFRMGELFKIFAAYKLTKVPIGSLVATTIIERIFDLLGLLLIVILIVSLFDVPNWISESSMIIGFFIFSCFLIMLIVIQL